MFSTRVSGVSRVGPCLRSPNLHLSATSRLDGEWPREARRREPCCASHQLDLLTGYLREEALDAVAVNVGRPQHHGGGSLQRPMQRVKRALPQPLRVPRLSDKRQLAAGTSLACQLTAVSTGATGLRCLEGRLASGGGEGAVRASHLLLLLCQAGCTVGRQIQRCHPPVSVATLLKQNRQCAYAITSRSLLSYHAPREMGSAHLWNCVVLAATLGHTALWPDHLPASSVSMIPLRDGESPGGCAAKTTL